MSDLDESAFTLDMLEISVRVQLKDRGARNLHAMRETTWHWYSCSHSVGSLLELSQDWGFTQKRSPSQREICIIVVSPCPECSISKREISPSGIAVILSLISCRTFCVDNSYWGQGAVQMKWSGSWLDSIVRHKTYLLGSCHWRSWYRSRGIDSQKQFR